MAAPNDQAAGGNPQKDRGGGGDYVLGVNSLELERLGLQHSLWTDAAHALWRRAGVQPGWRVLDVGCGPGYATLDLARLVGSTVAGPHPGEAVGVDESGAYLDFLAAQAAARDQRNVRGVRGNAQRLEEAAELDEGTFDAAYARWLMCFVAAPERVVQGVRRLLRPGGRFIVQDYFSYEGARTAPRGEAFRKVVLATGRAWRERGGDPDIMGRLPALLEAAGFTVEHLDVRQRLARPGEPMWHWPDSFWNYFGPVLTEMGLLTADDLSAWQREWSDLERTPGAFMLLPPVFELVAVRK